MFSVTRSGKLAKVVITLSMNEQFLSISYGTVQADFRNVLRSMYSTWKSCAIIFDIFHRDVAHSCSLSYRYFLALFVTFSRPTQQAAY